MEAFTVYFGCIVGIVTNNKDPEKLGRVKVNYPWLHNEKTEEGYWARITYPMGGSGRGFWYIPEVDDEVMLMLEHGDLRSPFVVGTLYNGVDRPPSFGEKGDQDFNADGGNNLRGMKSRCGHKLLFDDGGSAVKLEDKLGNIVHLDTDADSINTTANIDINIKAKAGDVNLNAPQGNVRINAGVNIEAHADVDVKVASDAATRIQAGSTLEAQSGTPMSISSKTTLDMTSAKPMTLNSNDKLSAGSKGPATIDAQGDMSISSSKDMGVSTGATMDVSAGTDFKGGTGSEGTWGAKTNLNIAGASAVLSGTSKLSVQSKGPHIQCAARIIKN